ncbi:MAG: tetratricopeptide repeat protein, partial [Anaerolineae bacterium]|nr:tetratricopeptide repeat protein [Anaerolineae bacterium]
TESLSLMHMGDVLRDMHQVERAKECLNRAVAISREIEGSREEYMSLLILSEIFEQEGDSIQALAHFKQYQSVKERFAGDKADLRLKVLKVTHDTETARKEAEIERLRAMELQRKNAEAAAMRRQLQRQLDYVQALSGCSQTLLENAKTEADQKQILNQALEHLRVGSRASRSYIYYSFQDPDLGDCLGIVAEACAPGIHPHDNPTNEIASWSRVPTSMFEALKVGQADRWLHRDSVRRNSRRTGSLQKSD